MAKRKVDRPERIDCHVHALGDGDPAKMKFGARSYVKRMRGEGIDAVVLIERGETCLKIEEKFGDFVIPVARVPMDESGRREVEHWLDRGCKGIKFIAPHHPYSDERYWPMYEAVEERKSVAVFHTGYLGFGGREAEKPPIRMEHMRAAQVDAVARRFPKLKILMSHFSNPWWEEAWKVSFSNQNVYADLSGGTAFIRSLDMWSRIFAPNGNLLKKSMERLCFGTDVHYFHTGLHYDLREITDFYQALLDRIDAPEHLRKKVWSGNARRLFGLTRR